MNQSLGRYFLYTGLFFVVLMLPAKAADLLIKGNAEYIGTAKPSIENAQEFTTCKGTSIPIEDGKLQKISKPCPQNPDRYVVQGGQQAPQAGQHELIGMGVVDQDNTAVGEVSNVLVDEMGQVQAVIVDRETGGLLGLGGERGDVAIPFNRLQLPQARPDTPSDEQNAKIDMTEEQLGELPEFENTRGEGGERGMQPGRTDQEPAMQQRGTQPGGTTDTQPGQQRQ